MTNQELKNEQVLLKMLKDQIEINIALKQENLELREKLKQIVYALEAIAHDTSHEHCAGCKEVECDLVQTARETLEEIKGIG